MDSLKGPANVHQGIDIIVIRDCPPNSLVLTFEEEIQSLLGLFFFFDQMRDSEEDDASHRIKYRTILEWLIPADAQCLLLISL